MSLSEHKGTEHQVRLYSRALTLEYANILNLVRLYGSMPTSELSSLLMKLVTDSLDHIEFTAALLRHAGIEQPSIMVDIGPKGDVRQALSRQLEMERLMAWTYRQLAERVAEDAKLRDQLVAVVSVEDGHAKTVEDIISTLRSP